ncbi:MAG: hypothetical protein U0797_23490 [Gemmataceae bacterium]
MAAAPLSVVLVARPRAAGGDSALVDVYQRCRDVSWETGLSAGEAETQQEILRLRLDESRQRPGGDG